MNWRWNLCLQERGGQCSKGGGGERAHNDPPTVEVWSPAQSHCPGIVSALTLSPGDGQLPPPKHSLLASSSKTFLTGRACLSRAETQRLAGLPAQICWFVRASVSALHKQAQMDSKSPGQVSSPKEWNNQKPISNKEVVETNTAMAGNGLQTSASSLPWPHKTIHM